jgi:predicted nucleic acid-binding Zn ribbon protein
MKHALLLLALVVTAAVSPSAAQTASVMPGQWTLDVGRSTYSPGPTPRSQHAVLTAIPNGIRTVADRVEADGRMVHFEWSGTFDGKDRPVAGDPARDAVSVKKIDDYTLEVTNKKGGTVTTVLHSEYAKDGKSRVETITGVDARGRTIRNVTYWTKS